VISIHILEELDAVCTREAAGSGLRLKELMAAAPGGKLMYDAERNYFPMPQDASGQDAILVGRTRQDLSDSGGRSIPLFVSGDQLLKGAALNAVQIAEAL
jgi:aspartate-semialdehyde dehydrogenase